MYKRIQIDRFDEGEYSLVPIRYEDRYEILRWRNDQINILRQTKPITPQEQDEYFNSAVANLFKIDSPPQLLWSLLKSNILIGYGGLVHIDWKSKNAEISFLTETLKA